MVEIKQLKFRKFRKWVWRFLGLALLAIAFSLFVDSQETGYAIALILLLLEDLFKFEATEEYVLVLHYCFLFFLLIPVAAGVLCFKRAKQIVSLSLRQKLAEDDRPPVLYLRSFKAERRAAWTTSFTVRGVTTEEEQLAEVINRVGPLVAIGAPGEKLPQLGAARGYFDDGDWKNQVRSLMKKARLVIFRAGDTEGFWWEVREAVKIVRPEKLLFLIPFSKKKYELFRQRAEKHLPCKLPEYVGRKVSDESLRAVLYFEQDWTPHMLRLRGSALAYWLKVIFSPFVNIINLVTFIKKKPLVRILERTLEPVFERVAELKDTEASDSPGVGKPNKANAADALKRS